MKLIWIMTGLGNFKGGYFVRRDSTLLLEYDGERLNFFFESEFSEEEPSLEPSDLYTAVMFSYSRFLLGKFLRSDLRPFLLSSARHSIPLFYKEIDYEHEINLYENGSRRLTTPKKNLEVHEHKFPLDFIFPCSSESRDYVR